MIREIWFWKKLFKNIYQRHACIQHFISVCLFLILYIFFCFQLFIVFEISKVIHLDDSLSYGYTSQDHFYSQQYWNWTTLIHLHLVQHWFTSTDWSKYVLFIHLLIQIHNFSKIHITFERIESFINICSLSCCCIYKKEERQRQHAEQIYNLLLNTVVFVRETYLLCDSC